MKKMDIHNLTAKDIKKLHIWLRALIQVLYFLFIPSVYTVAFAGVKYIFTQIGAGEKVAVTSFVTVLVDLHLHHSVRKILLRIRLCVRYTGRWCACTLCVDL